MTLRLMPRSRADELEALLERFGVVVDGLHKKRCLGYHDTNKNLERLGAVADLKQAKALVFRPPTARAYEIPGS